MKTEKKFRSEYCKEEKASVVLNGKIIGHYIVHAYYQDVIDDNGRVRTELINTYVIGQIIKKK